LIFGYGKQGVPANDPSDRSEPQVPPLRFAPVGMTVLREREELRANSKPLAHGAERALAQSAGRALADGR